jgi:hypothetical protein
MTTIKSHIDFFNKKIPRFISKIIFPVNRLRDHILEINKKITQIIEL